MSESIYVDVEVFGIDDIEDCVKDEIKNLDIDDLVAVAVEGLDMADMISEYVDNYLAKNNKQTIQFTEDEADVLRRFIVFIRTWNTGG